MGELGSAGAFDELTWCWLCIANFGAVTDAYGVVGDELNESVAGEWCVPYYAGNIRSITTKYPSAGTAMWSNIDKSRSQKASITLN